jgi:hypothetical protein
VTQPAARLQVIFDHGRSAVLAFKKSGDRNQYASVLKLATTPACIGNALNYDVLVRHGRAVLEITEGAASGWLKSAYDDTATLHDVFVEWVQGSASNKLYVAGNILLFLKKIAQYDTDIAKGVGRAIVLNDTAIMTLGRAIHEDEPEPENPKLRQKEAQDARSGIPFGKAPANQGLTL